MLVSSSAFSCANAPSAVAGNPPGTHRPPLSVGCGSVIAGPAVWTVITCGCAAWAGSCSIGQVASASWAATAQYSPHGGVGARLDDMTGALLESVASRAVTVAVSPMINTTTATVIPSRLRPARRRAWLSMAVSHIWSRPREMRDQLVADAVENPAGHRAHHHDHAHAAGAVVVDPPAASPDHQPDEEAKQQGDPRTPLGVTHEPEDLVRARRRHRRGIRNRLSQRDDRVQVLDHERIP